MLHGAAGPVGDLSGRAGLSRGSPRWSSTTGAATADRCAPSRPGGMHDHALDLLALAAALLHATRRRRPQLRLEPNHAGGDAPAGRLRCARPVGPPLPVEWRSGTTKAYNARVADSDAPADDIEEMYRRLLGTDAWARLPDEVRAQRRAEGPAFQTDMASEIAAPFAFPDMVVPALIGTGSETSAEHAHGARGSLSTCRTPAASWSRAPGTSPLARTPGPSQTSSCPRRRCRAPSEGHRSRTQRHPNRVSTFRVICSIWGSRPASP